MNIKCNFVNESGLNLLLELEKKRQDSQYALWIKISSITSILFGCMALVFQSLKAFDTARIAFLMTAACLSIAVITEVAYRVIIGKRRAPPSGPISVGASPSNIPIIDENLFVLKELKDRVKDGTLNLSQLGEISDSTWREIVYEAIKYKAETVDLRGTKVSLKGIQLLLNKTPQLKSLDLDQVGFTPGNHSISFTVCDNISEKSILSVLKYCPSTIVSINVDECKNVTDDFMKFIGEYPPLVNSVQLLNVWRCGLITSTGCSHIKNLTKLTSLSAPRSLQIEGLIELLKTCGSRLSFLRVNPHINPDLNVFSKQTCFVSDKFDNPKLRLALSEESIILLLTPFKNLTKLSLRHSNLSDKSCEVLPTQLTWLAIQGSFKLTNKSVKIIADRCQDLELLALDDSPVNDEIFEDLLRLKKLKGLHLAGKTSITFEGLKKFLEICNQIEEININRTPFTDDKIFEPLTLLKNLKRIHLGATKITFKSLKNFLERSVQIEEINISANSFTDDIFVPLTSLKNLKRILLAGTKITFEGLKNFLGRCGKIEEVNISGTSITSENLEELRGIYVKKDKKINFIL